MFTVYIVISHFHIMVRTLHPLTTCNTSTQSTIKTLDSKITVTSPTVQQVKFNQFWRWSEWPVSSQLQQDINKRIATSGRPIMIVDAKGLEQVLRITLPNDSYKLPCRWTLDVLLTKLYGSKTTEMKARVENEAYCGITGHSIDANWQMQYAVLEYVPAMNVTTMKMLLYCLNTLQLNGICPANWRL